MTFSDVVSLLGNFSAAATAFVALAFGIGRWASANDRMNRLEGYLKKEKRAGKDKGERSILNVMAAVRLTEAEALQASFRSNKIVVLRHTDPGSGLTDALLFAYKD